MRELKTRKLTEFKKASMLLLAMAILAGAVNNMMPVNDVSAKSILVDPPVFPVNTLTNFVITKIIPGESYLEAKYEKVDETEELEFPNYVHIGFGMDPSDYELSMVGNGGFDDETIVDVGLAVRLSSTWENGEIIPINSFANRGGDLYENETGRMFYNLIISSNKSLTGRIDYSRCTNSTVFLSGQATECRAEILDGNKIQYQPYDRLGNRLEIPADEDAVLTAAIESVVYESGDWPPIYKIVPDDPVESTDEPTDTTDASTGGLTGSSTDGPADDPTGESTDGLTDGSADEPTSGPIDETTSGVDSSLANKELVATLNDAQQGNKSNDQSSDSANNQNSNQGKTSIVLEIADNSDSNASENEKTTTNVETAAISDSDDVGVPELGKETNEKPSTLWLITIVLIAVALVVGWWFLFFGKYKSNNQKKGEKSSDR